MTTPSHHVPDRKIPKRVSKDNMKSTKIFTVYCCSLDLCTFTTDKKKFKETTVAVKDLLKAHDIDKNNFAKTPKDKFKFSRICVSATPDLRTQNSATIRTEALRPPSVRYPKDKKERKKAQNKTASWSLENV